MKLETIRLDLNISLDASDMTLLELAAIADRIKYAIDPDGPRRYLRMRLGHTEGVSSEARVELAQAVDERSPERRTVLPAAPAPTESADDAWSGTRVLAQLAATSAQTNPQTRTQPIPPDPLVEQRIARREILAAVDVLRADHPKEHWVYFTDAVRDYLNAEEALEKHGEL